MLRRRGATKIKRFIDTLDAVPTGISEQGQSLSMKAF
jgi:hypothetical protein